MATTAKRERWLCQECGERFGGKGAAVVHRNLTAHVVRPAMAEERGVLAGHVADGLGHTNPATECRCNGGRS